MMILIERGQLPAPAGGRALRRQARRGILLHYMCMCVYIYIYNIHYIIL